MSAAEFTRFVEIPRLGRIIVEASSTDGEVWFSLAHGNASVYSFIPAAKARELAAALTAAADATDEATREAEGVKL